MSKTGSRRFFRWVGWMIVLLILMGAVTPIMRVIWPMFVYPPLLLSLPTPPGRVSGSGHFGGAELDFRGWEYIYDVEQPYEEVVDFFKTNLTRRGWELTRESSRSSWTPHLQSNMVRAVLVFHGPYLPSFDIQIEVLAEMKQGKQIGPVRVFIYDEPH